MAHATLTITLERHINNEDGSDGNITCEMTGCDESIRRALTFLMLNNKSFKEIFNGAVRAANKIRQAKEN